MTLIRACQVAQKCLVFSIWLNLSVVKYCVLCTFVTFICSQLCCYFSLTGRLWLNNLGEVECRVLRWICDALSHSDDMTSFQGVVQHKQAWLDLSKLRSFGCFSMMETQPGLCALTLRLCILQAMRMGYVSFKWVSVWFKRWQRASCAIKPALGCCVHIPPPLIQSTHAQALHTVFPETMPGAASLRKSGSVCVLYAAALSECGRGGRGR